VALVLSQSADPNHWTKILIGVRLAIIKEGVFGEAPCDIVLEIVRLLSNFWYDDRKFDRANSIVSPVTCYVLCDIDSRIHGVVFRPPK
jgi:hypothetical protein